MQTCERGMSDTTKAKLQHKVYAHIIIRIMYKEYRNTVCVAGEKATIQFRTSAAEAALRPSKTRLLLDVYL